MKEFCTNQDNCLQRTFSRAEYQNIVATLNTSNWFITLAIVESDLIIRHMKELMGAYNARTYSRGDIGLSSAARTDMDEWSYATLFLQAFQLRTYQTRAELTRELIDAPPDPTLKEMGVVCTAIAMAFNGYKPNGGMEIFDFMNQLFGFQVVYQIEIPGRTQEWWEREKYKAQYDDNSDAEEAWCWVYKTDAWSNHGDNTGCWNVMVRSSYDLMKRMQEKGVTPDRLMATKSVLHIRIGL